MYVVNSVIYFFATEHPNQWTIVKSVKDRLRKNPDTLKEYDKIIKAQLEEGIIEIINDEDKNSVMVTYLPPLGRD